MTLVQHLTYVIWREEHLWNITVFVGRGSYWYWFLIEKTATFVSTTVHALLNLAEKCFSFLLDTTYGIFSCRERTGRLRQFRLADWQTD
jgi:hypothetical protein